MASPIPKAKAKEKPSEIEEEIQPVETKPPPPPPAAPKPPSPPAAAAAEKGPSPPPPPPKPIEIPKTAASAKEDEKKLIEEGALPLSKEMKKFMKNEPSKPAAAAGWVVGLIEEDDVLDYLQDVKQYKILEFLQK